MDYKKLKLIEWDFENVTYGNDMHQNLDLNENNNVDMEDILTDINDALKKITERNG